MNSPAPPSRAWLARPGTRLGVQVLVAITGGLVVTLVLAATKFEPGRDRVGMRATGGSATGGAGHRWGFKFWDGGAWSRDSGNIAISPATDPTLPIPANDLTDTALGTIPHAAWRKMVREIAALPPQKNVFFNVQAWGAPFRALAGGGANTSPSLSWYWEFTLGSREYQIPARPMWPGLLADTLIYAMPLFVLLRVASRLGRAARRRRAGLCATCGYSLKGLKQGAPCPECGRTAGAS